MYYQLKNHPILHQWPLQGLPFSDHYFSFLPVLHKHIVHLERMIDYTLPNFRSTMS